MLIEYRLNQTTVEKDVNLAASTANSQILGSEGIAPFPVFAIYNVNRSSRWSGTRPEGPE